VAVLAIFSVDEGCEADDYSVITRGGVIIKVDDWLAGAVGDVCFEFFE
jgi:hypothetical protein